MVTARTERNIGDGGKTCRGGLPRRTRSGTLRAKDHRLPTYRPGSTSSEVTYTSIETNWSSEPAKEGLKALVQKTRECIKGCVGQTAQTLINKLQTELSEVGAIIIATSARQKPFGAAERIIQSQLYRWARRKPAPTVTLRFSWKTQILQPGGPVRVFHADTRQRRGQSAVLRLYSIARTVLEWHIKVRGEANPYDPVHRVF